MVVRILDPDGDKGFSLALTGAGNVIATPVSRVVRTLVGGASVDVVEHRLLLSSDRPRAPVPVRLRVTDVTADVSDRSSPSVPDALIVCFVNANGVCPSAPPAAGGGGGGGATGLLWLAATGGAFSLRIRRRWRAARRLRTRPSTNPPSAAAPRSPSSRHLSVVRFLRQKARFFVFGAFQSPARSRGACL